MERDVPPTVVTEYLDGGSLTQLLEKQEGKPLPISEQLELALGITAGLRYLHNCTPPVIHRDLSTNNILLAQGRMAKLTDFGMGRPPAFLYMPPELFCKQPHGTSGDIYSLGLILYYLVTGEPPFKGLSDAEAATQAAKLHARPVIPESIPTAWRDLIQSCWHRNPMQRPTAIEVHEKLSKLGSDRAVSVPPTANVIPPAPRLLDTWSLIDVSRETVLGKSYVCHASGSELNTSALLQYQLGLLVGEAKYSDFVIVTSDLQRIPTHRAILASRSPHFAALIEEAGEAREIEISGKHATPAAVRALLEFLYTGHLEVRNETIYDLMEAARRLHMTQALEICQEFVEDNGVPLRLASQESGESGDEGLLRMRTLTEGIMSVESNLLEVESVLELLNEKLEKVTNRMSEFPLFLATFIPSSSLMNDSTAKLPDLAGR